MAVNLASKMFGFPRTVLKAGGGGGGAHPFRFVDASTTNPVATKTKIDCLSNLVDVLYPFSTMPITATGGSGSYSDPIEITQACYIYLKCTVSLGVVTAAEITKTDPSDGELIKYDTATPPAQTAFYVILAQVVSGSQPTEPGYDFSIDEDPYHLTQVAFSHLRVEQRVTSGRLATLAVPV